MESLREIADRILPLLTYDPQAPMLFSSGLFLFLFAAFAFFYGFMRRTPTLRIWYVIAFSLYFYYKSSGIYLLLLVGVSISDFWIGRAIAQTTSQRAKRGLVTLSIAADLAVLGYFKYTNFFIEIARNLFGAGFLEFQNIFLPVGISFFLFQSLSYTIDIYRGTLKTAGATTSSTSRSFRSWSPARSSVPATFWCRSGRIPSPSRVKCPARASF